MNYSSLFETIDGDFDTLNNDELFDLSLSDKLTEMTTLTNSSKSSHSNLNHIDQTTLNSRQIDHLNLLSLSNELAKFYHWNSLPSPEYIHNSFNFSFSPSPRQSIAHDRNSSIVPTDYIVQDSSSVPNDSTLGNNFLQMDSSLAPAMPPTMNPTMANSIAPSMGASLAPAMVSDTVNPTMASNINGDLNTSRAGSNGCVGPDSSMEQTINPRQLFSIIPQSVSSPALSTLFNAKQKMSVPKLPDQSKVQFDLNDKINFKMNDMNNWYGINMNWDMEENKVNRMNNNFNDNCDINNIPINDQLFLNENDLNAANSSSLQQPLHMPLPTIRQGRSQSMSSPVISGMNPQLRRNSIATPEIGKRKRRKSNEISSNKGNSPINHGHSRGSSITSLPKSYSNTSIKENISSTSTAVLNNQISPLTNNFNAQFPDAGSSNSSSSSNVAGYPLVVTSFPCTECDKQFKRSEHLKRHIRSVHSNIRPFHCKYCEKKFSRSDNLAQHLKTHYRTDANGNPTIIYGNPNNQRKSKK